MTAESPHAPCAAEAPWWFSGRAGPPAVWNERGAWIGDDACRACHAAESEGFAGNAHAAVMRPGPGLGCEACHGPAGRHRDAPETPGLVDAFAKLDARAAEERCVRCHFESLRARGVRGAHARVTAVTCTACHAAHHEAPAAAPAPSELAPAAGACARCHAEAIRAHLRSDHGALVSGPGARGCEVCHGPGEEHVRASGRPGTIRVPAPPEQDGLCRDCHRGSPALARWDSSDHARAGVACAACHTLLGDPLEPASRRELRVCGGCHAAEAAEFRLPNRHPLPEGTMACSSCHDVHGGRSTPFSRRALDDRCVSCHPGTAGPFVFEHEADRTEGCGACHAPHGSPNRRLLTVWPVRDLCLQCHPATPPNHDLSSFSPFLECARCHTEVHGSDIDPLLFR